MAQWVYLLPMVWVQIWVSQRARVEEIHQEAAEEEVKAEGRVSKREFLFAVVVLEPAEVEVGLVIRAQNVDRPSLP